MSTPTVAYEVLSRGVATLHVEHHAVSRQKFISHSDCRLHEAAMIAAKIENKAGCALLSELCESHKKLWISGIGKLVNFYVACLFVQHVCRLNALYGNIVSSYCKISQSLFAGAYNTYSNF